MYDKLFFWKSPLDHDLGDRLTISPESEICREKISKSREEEKVKFVLKSTYTEKCYTICDIVINSYDSDVKRVGCDLDVVEDCDPEIKPKGILTNPKLLSFLKSEGFDIANGFTSDGGDYRLSSKLIDNITKNQLYKLLCSVYVQSVDIKVEEVDSLQDDKTDDNYQRSTKINLRKDLEKTFSKKVVDRKIFLHKDTEDKFDIERNTLIHLIKNVNPNTLLHQVVSSSWVWKQHSLTNLLINSGKNAICVKSYDGLKVIQFQPGKHPNGELYNPYLEHVLASLGYDIKRDLRLEFGDYDFTLMGLDKITVGHLREILDSGSVSSIDITLE